MSRTSRRKAGTLLAGAVIGVLALAGCGAGQITQTAEQASTAAGATASVGPIKVLDAKIEFSGRVQGAAAYPAGGDAPVAMRIVNISSATDRLVAVSSPVATTVQTSGSNEIAPGVPLVVGGTGGEQATTGASTTGTVPGQPGEAQIVLSGLTEPIRSGISYPIVLVFEQAGQMRLDIPVEIPTQPRS